MALKPNDIRNMADFEIVNKISALRAELFKFRFEQKTGRVEKPHNIKKARESIARCLTILREKKNAKK